MVKAGEEQADQQVTVFLLPIVLLLATMEHYYPGGRFEESPTLV